MSDEYSKQVKNEQPSLNEKLADARAFIASHKTVLLTTRSPNGQLHARTMAIAEVTPDWKFRFIYDGESYKEKEVDNDKHVNIAYDGAEKNAGWISIAGVAEHSNDKALVEKLYNPTIKAWFGDKGDGVHDGSASDPRVAVLEVTVEQIRHFYQKRTTLGTVADVVASAVTGNVAQPGEIRQIEGKEIADAWAKGELKEAGL